MSAKTSQWPIPRSVPVTHKWRRRTDKRDIHSWGRPCWLKKRMNVELVCSTSRRCMHCCHLRLNAVRTCSISSSSIISRWCLAISICRLITIKPDQSCVYFRWFSQQSRLYHNLIRAPNMGNFNSKEKVSSHKLKLKRMIKNYALQSEKPETRIDSYWNLFWGRNSTKNEVVGLSLWSAIEKGFTNKRIMRKT